MKRALAVQGRAGAGLAGRMRSSRRFDSSADETARIRRDRSFETLPARLIATMRRELISG